MKTAVNCKCIICGALFIKVDLRTANRCPCYNADRLRFLAKKVLLSDKDKKNLISFDIYCNDLRNLVKQFGQDSSYKLYSGESIEKETTYDHPSGMKNIVRGTNIKYNETEDEKQLNEVVAYIKAKCIVIKVSKKLNVNDLREAQKKKITAEEYYDCCKGIYKGNVFLTKEEFCLLAAELDMFI